jgi:hypothetical protein
MKALRLLFPKNNKKSKTTVTSIQTNPRMIPNYPKIEKE